MTEPTFEDEVERDAALAEIGDDLYDLIAAFIRKLDQEGFDSLWDRQAESPDQPKVLEALEKFVKQYSSDQAEARDIKARIRAAEKRHV